VKASELVAIAHLPENVRRFAIVAADGVAVFERSDFEAEDESLTVWHSAAPAQEVR
jgi:hypothetical protein